MPKYQDWLDIFEETGKIKPGTKPKRGVPNIVVLGSIRDPEMMGGNKGGYGQAFGTGAGADGVVQPNKPAAIDHSTNPPSVYHEGETIVPFPGGKHIIPAQTEQQQAQLGRMEKEQGLPGYQEGGTVYDDNRPTADLTTSPQASPYENAQLGAFNRIQQQSQGQDPYMNTASNRALQDFDARAATGSTQLRQSVASNPYMTDSAKNAAAANMQSRYQSGVSDLTGNLAQTSQARMADANRQVFDLGRQANLDDRARQQWEKAFGESQYQVDVAKDQWQQQWDHVIEQYGDQESQRMANDANVMDFDSWKEKYGDGVTEEQYNSARAVRDMELRSMDLNNQASEERLDQLRKSPQWEALEHLLNAGDFDGYEAAFKALTGQDIDTETFKQDREMHLRQQNMVIESQAFGLETQRHAHYLNQLQTGVPMNTVAQQIMADNPGMPEFRAMQIAQSMYTRSIARGEQIEAANLMLQSGDYTGAQAIFSQTYPGVNFDFSRLTDQQARADFDEGMGLLTSIVSSTSTWEQALPLIQGSNIEALFGSAVQGSLEDVYTTLKLQTDEVYQAMWSMPDEVIDAIKPEGMDSDHYRTLLGRFSIFKGTTTDENGNLVIDADLMSEIMGKSSENTTTPGETPESVDLDKPHQVKDETGKVVASFDSEAEARNYIGPGDSFSYQDKTTWQQRFDKAQDDPRFGEMEDRGHISSELWEKSGAANMEEYRGWFEKEGFLNVVPDKRPDGEWWKSSQFSGLTTEQLKTLGDSKPQYKAPENSTDTLDALIARESGSDNSWWTNYQGVGWMPKGGGAAGRTFRQQVQGKIVTVNGQGYIAVGMHEANSQSTGLIGTGPNVYLYDVKLYNPETGDTIFYSSIKDDDASLSSVPEVFRTISERLSVA